MVVLYCKMVFGLVLREGCREGSLKFDVFPVIRHSQSAENQSMSHILFVSRVDAKINK